MSRARRSLPKAAPLTRVEQRELTLMPETLFVEVEGAKDAVSDDAVLEDAIACIQMNAEDCYDDGIVSEYRLVRRFRKRTETTTHCDPV